MPVKFQDDKKEASTPGGDNSPPAPPNEEEGTVSTHYGVRRLFCLGNEDEVDDDDNWDEFNDTGPFRKRSPSFLELMFGTGGGHDAELTLEEKMAAKRIGKHRKSGGNKGTKRGMKNKDAQVGR